MRNLPSLILDQASGDAALCPRDFHEKVREQPMHKLPSESLPVLLEMVHLGSGLSPIRSSQVCHGATFAFWHNVRCLAPFHIPFMGLCRKSVSLLTSSGEIWTLASRSRASGASVDRSVLKVS